MSKCPPQQSPSNYYYIHKSPWGIWNYKTKKPVFLCSKRNVLYIIHISKPFLSENIYK